MKYSYSANSISQINTTISDLFSHSFGKHTSVIAHIIINDIWLYYMKLYTIYYLHENQEESQTSKSAAHIDTC